MLLGATIPAAFAQAPEECRVPHKFTKENTIGHPGYVSINSANEPFTSYLSFLKADYSGNSNQLTTFGPEAFVNNKFCVQMMITMPGYSSSSGIDF